MKHFTQATEKNLPSHQSFFCDTQDVVSETERDVVLCCGPFLEPPLAVFLGAALVDRDQPKVLVCESFQIIKIAKFEILPIEWDVFCWKWSLTSENNFSSEPVLAGIAVTMKVSAKLHGANSFVSSKAIHAPSHRKQANKEMFMSFWKRKQLKDDNNAMEKEILIGRNPESPSQCPHWSWKWRVDANQGQR